MNDNRHHPFRDSHQDREEVKGVPDTPQTRAPSYALAFADDDFMCREELRPVRLQLELLKPKGWTLGKIPESICMGNFVQHGVN